MEKDSSRPIFIIGCPRSGNTLLACILCRHPELFIFFELGVGGYLYRNWISRTGGDDIHQPERFADHLLEFWSYWLEERTSLRLSKKRIVRCVEKGGDNYGDALSRCMFMMARQVKENVKQWGDKTPQHIGAMEEIQDLYPGARFIHIRRDPRSVVASLSKPSFTPASNAPLFNTDIVRQYWHAYQTNKQRVSPESLYEIRYEDLVGSPSSTIKELCTFLRIPYTEKFFEEAEPSVREATGWPSYKGWEEIKPSLADPPDLDPTIRGSLASVADEMGYSVSSSVADRLFSSFRMLPTRIARFVAGRAYELKYSVSNTFFQHEPITMEKMKTWLR